MQQDVDKELRPEPEHKRQEPLHDKESPDGCQCAEKYGGSGCDNAGGTVVDDESGVPEPLVEVETGELQEVDVELLQRELAEQKAKAEDYFSRLARLQADFDNFRKRTGREREELFKYASASLCELLLPVLDNFELALAAKQEDPAKVVEGVEMIHRQLLEVLQKEGLNPIEAVGKMFDPTKHEAVLQEETEEYPDNTVTAELRRGYYLKDKLIRPAMVKVARSGG